MNLVNIIKNVSKTTKSLVVKAEKKAYKHGPTAMVAVGVGCLVVGTVVAVKAAVTPNDEGEDVVTEVNQFKDRCEAIDNSSESTQKWLRFRTKAMEAVRLAKKLFRRFVWAVVLAACGTALIFGGHKIVLARLSTAGAMVTSLTDNLKDLEDRVREHLPEDKADEILYDKKVEEKNTIDPETDNITVEQNVKEEYHRKGLSDPWCIAIDENTCPMVNFIDSNRRKAWEDIINTVTTINVYDIGKHGGVTAYDLYRELHYNMNVLSKEALAQSKVIGKYAKPATEPLSNSMLELVVSKSALEQWFNGDSDTLYVYPDWDGYVADKF